MPYKEVEETLEKLNCQKRSANNHVKIAECTNIIGDILSKIKSEVVVESNGDADDLYMYVDGGHVKDKDREKDDGKRQREKDKGEDKRQCHCFNI